jgi:hypothetical protein
MRWFSLARRRPAATHARTDPEHARRRRAWRRYASRSRATMSRNAPGNAAARLSRMYSAIEATDDRGVGLGRGEHHPHSTTRTFPPIAFAISATSASRPARYWRISFLESEPRGGISGRPLCREMSIGERHFADEAANPERVCHFLFHPASLLRFRPSKGCRFAGSVRTQGRKGSKDPPCGPCILALWHPPAAQGKLARKACVLARSLIGSPMRAAW